MVDRLTADVVGVITDARARAGDPATDERLAEIAARLQGPLRLAIAGKVKAGKSTLLNALLGEELAATDAGECTKIVTWYVHGDAPQVRLFPREGPPRDASYRRDAGGPLEIDLQGLDPESIDHLEVAWPSGRLRELTILDTPGTASISADVSARTHRVLEIDDGRVPVADAVLYLLRHAHASDARFLESFHDDEVAHGSPMNAVGVLSRADEIGSCRTDALEVAGRVARRYEAEPRLRRLCPVVVPVDGLLALAATTLQEAEFALLAHVAEAPTDAIAQLLLSADRFATRPSSAPLTELERAHLLERMGLFGVRLCVDLIRRGTAPNAVSLSSTLVDRSGLTRLRSVLARQFEDRARVRKARAAIAALDHLLREGSWEDPTSLLARLEEVRAGAHEFEELRLLARIRSGTVQLTEERATALDRLLGGFGHDPATRLGLDAGADARALQAAAIAALDDWQHVAHHPLTSGPERAAARTASRTLEGLLADAESGGPVA